MRYEPKTLFEYIGSMFFRGFGFNGDLTQLIKTSFTALMSEGKGLIVIPFLSNPDSVTSEDALTVARSSVRSLIYPNERSSSLFEDFLVVSMLLTMNAYGMISYPMLVKLFHEFTRPECTWSTESFDVLAEQMATIPFEDVISPINQMRDEANSLVVSFSEMARDVFYQNLKGFQSEYQKVATAQVCSCGDSDEKFDEVIACRTSLFRLAWYYKTVICYSDVLQRNDLVDLPI